MIARLISIAKTIVPIIKIQYLSGLLTKVLIDNKYKIQVEVQSLDLDTHLNLKSISKIQHQP